MDSNLSAVTVFDEEHATTALPKEVLSLLFDEEAPEEEPPPPPPSSPPPPAPFVPKTIEQRALAISDGEEYFTSNVVTLGFWSNFLIILWAIVTSFVVPMMIISFF